MARGFVKDSVEHVGGVLSLSCAVRCDRAAHCFAIVVDAGQLSLLSYYMDLGLTAGVGPSTGCTFSSNIPRLAIRWDCQSFLSGEDGTWGMIWRVIGVIGEGAVPSYCCAVLCRGLALGTFGGNRGVWTLVGVQVGRAPGFVGEIVAVCTPGGGEPREVGDNLGDSMSS